MDFSCGWYVLCTGDLYLFACTLSTLLLLLLIMQMPKMGGATGLHVTLTVVLLASLCKCVVGQGSA